MLNKYDVLEKLIDVSGIIGHVMVYVSMIAGVILFWYLLFKML